MKKFVLAILFFIFVYAPYAYALVPTTTGIIPGQIWYSKDPLSEGDKVFIYTAVWNGVTNPLQAKVEFYDKNVILGTRDVTVPANALQEVFVSWQVTSGDHTISARIISSSITSGGKKEIVTLQRVTTDTDETFVPVKAVAVLPTDALKKDVSKVVATVTESIPPSVATTVSAFDTTRAKVAENISKSLTDAKTKIAILNAGVKEKIPAKKGSLAGATSTKPLDATEKPITYVKIFLLSIVSFIFGHTIVFYGLLVFILFLILRFIYRKIRNR